MNSPSVRPILGAPPRKSDSNGAVIREQFYRSLLESISDRLCVLDRYGVVVYLNCGRGAFSMAPRDTLYSLGLGTNFLLASEAAVRNGTILARERLNGVLAVLQRRQLHFELRYPNSIHPNAKNALLTIEPMPDEYGGAIIRMLDMPTPGSASAPGKWGNHAKFPTRVGDPISLKPSRNRYSFHQGNGKSAWPSTPALPHLASSRSNPGRAESAVTKSTPKQLTLPMGEVDRRLQSAQEDERKRIARELHDDVSQSLALCMLTLDQILELPEAMQSPVRSQMVSLHEHLGTIASDVHRISHNLCPNKLIELGLVPALRRLLKDVSETKTIQVALHTEGILADIPQQNTIALYRIAQECLNNIVKYSGAQSAEISLKTARGGVELTVSDNGIGFDLASLNKSPGLGFRNMQERVQAAGGTFKIKSKPRCGTKITVWVGEK
jgi:signal transduction histidine kinase